MVIIMSIIDTFDNATEAIISPSAMVTSSDNFPEIAIAIFNSKLINLALAASESYETDEFGLTVGDVYPIYKLNYKGTRVALYQTFIGGPISAALLEEMIAKGTKKLIIFGSCGVLDNALVEGHLIVPTSCYRDEGTSYHYVAPADYIDVPTAVRTAEILTELNAPLILGKNWTTDGFYRETRGNMEKRKAEGCITVDMECASLQAVAQFRGVEVYQFLIAADSLDGDEWAERNLANPLEGQHEKLLNIALEMATRV